MIKPLPPNYINQCHQYANTIIMTRGLLFKLKTAVILQVLCLLGTPAGLLWAQSATTGPAKDSIEVWSLNYQFLAGKNTPAALERFPAADSAIRKMADPPLSSLHVWVDEGNVLVKQGGFLGPTYYLVNKQDKAQIVWTADRQDYEEGEEGEEGVEVVEEKEAAGEQEAKEAKRLIDSIADRAGDSGSGSDSDSDSIGDPTANNSLAAKRHATRSLVNLPSVLSIQDSIYIIDPADLDFHRTDKTDTVMGMVVKLGYFDMPDPFQGIKLHVWYAERLPKVYWDKFGYFQKLDGAPMAMFVSNGNRQIGFQIQAIEKVKVPAAYFALPDGYTLDEISWDRASAIEKEKRRVLARQEGAVSTVEQKPE